MFSQLHSGKAVLRHVREQNYFIFEVFVVLRLFALMLPTISRSMLIQDKICLFQYNQSVAFCTNIHLESEQGDNSSTIPVKDVILAEAAQFNSYSNIIESAAMVVWSLFVGSFNDNFWNGTVVVMLLAVFGDLWSSGVSLVLVYFYQSSPYLILLTSLSAWFSGAIMAFNATAYRYIALNIEEKYRRIKFIILEILFVIDVSLSQYLSGQLVAVNPSSTSTDSSTPQLRTYHRNFLLTIATDLVLLVLLAVIYRILKRKHKNESFNNNNSIGQLNHSNIDGNNNNSKQNNAIGTSDSTSKVSTVCGQLEANQQSLTNQRDSSTPKPNKNKFVLLRLFDMRNVRQTVHCFFKSRPHHIRLQIYLLCGVLFSQTLVTNGLATVLLQFSEKVYHWSASTYATWSAIQTVSQMCLMAVFLLLLIRLLHLRDRTLIVIAQFSVLVMDLIRGVLLDPMAFFVSLPLGALTGLGSISAKNKISLIIPANEVGKVFSVSSTIEALVPLVASVLYSTLFRLSISTYPGLIYLFSCVVMLVSLAAMALERFYCPVDSIRDFCTSEHENSA